MIVDAVPKDDTIKARVDTIRAKTGINDMISESGEIAIGPSGIDQMFKDSSAVIINTTNDHLTVRAYICARLNRLAVLYSTA
jgi:hypothetical protein